LLQCTAILLLLNTCFAEEILPGHSSHGEAFNEGPRQQAYLMGNTGKVQFEADTDSKEAQAFINQGVGQLHGFWFFEAERSFRQAATLAPECAIAYWGMARANVENEKRARGFIKRAVELRSKASSRGQMWIDALAGYLKEGAKDKERRAKYVEDLAAIMKAFPDDLEAKAFYAVQVWKNSSKGIKITDHEKVDAVLKSVLAANPEHPCHHYRIHLWDRKQAANALDAAARCGQASPGIAHMWHMPGHIFSKLQRYSDAAWQQEASARVDHAHMMRDRVLPDQIHNYAHNNEWLIRNLSHLGRVREAISLAKNMIELPRHPKFNHLGKTGSSSHYGRRRLQEILVRYELWEQLIALSGSPWLEGPEAQEEQLYTASMKGIALSRLNRFEDAQKELAKVQAIQKEVKEKQTEAATKAEEKAKNEKKKPNEIKNLMNKAKGPFNRNINFAASAIAELKGWEALAAGDTNIALEHFNKAKQSSKGRLAQAALLTGEIEKAVKLAKEFADKAKGQVQPAALHADILYQAKKFKEAYSAFYKLRILAHSADSDLPVFERLRPVSLDLKLGTHWQETRQLPDDLGKRPSLKALGQFRWQPVDSPSWRLPGIDGARFSKRSFKRQPVILIFYLGHRCLHCIQQLTAFGPATREFEAAGISLLGISTDSVEELEEVHHKAWKGDGDFPFPLAADPSLKTFKEFNAFDDFEQIPLHGTFLIDAQGYIRWQDISFEPFTDTKFLLKESQRLLSQPRVKKRLFGM
jgi:peroxiredoxin